MYLLTPTASGQHVENQEFLHVLTPSRAIAPIDAPSYPERSFEAQPASLMSATGEVFLYRYFLGFACATGVSPS